MESPRDGVDRSLYTRLTPWRTRYFSRSPSPSPPNSDPASSPRPAQQPSADDGLSPADHDAAASSSMAAPSAPDDAAVAAAVPTSPAATWTSEDAFAPAIAASPPPREMTSDHPPAAVQHHVSHPHRLGGRRAPRSSMFDIAMQVAHTPSGYRRSLLVDHGPAIRNGSQDVLPRHTAEELSDQVRVLEESDHHHTVRRSVSNEDIDWHSRLTDDQWSRHKATFLQRAWHSWRYGKFVIVPDIGDNRLVNRLLDFWDIIVVIGILGTAIVLPFEVTLANIADFRYLRVLDFCFDVSFASDIFLQFFIAVPNHHAIQSTDLWERDPLKIALRYCSLPLCCRNCTRLGWFWIDVTSVFPFACLLGESDPHTIRLFRMLRLVRMLSLLRLMRLFDRWQAVFGFSYHLVSLVEFLGLTFFSCHWLACVWVMAEGSLYHGDPEMAGPHGEPGRTWLTALIDSKGDPCHPSAREDPLCVYSLALYFATMTLTTVGFGDIVPQNILEYRMTIIMVMISGIIWAYVVGRIVNIIATWDPSVVQFRQNLDDLNEMCSNRNLPHDLRCRLRSYMHEAKFIQRIRSQRGLVISHLSPGLQGEVALQSVGSVIHDNVYWARELEEAAIIDLATRLQAALFAPREHIVMPMSLVILMRGVAACFGRVLSRGHVWGHDRVLLESFFLIESFVPRTLSYVEVLSLSKDDVRAVCANFPAADKKVRRAQIRLATIRAIVALADVVRQWREEDPSWEEEMAVRNTTHTVVTTASFNTGEDCEVQSPTDVQKPWNGSSQVDQVARNLEIMERATRELKQWNVYGSFCGLNGPTGGHEVSIRQELNAMEERVAGLITTAMSELSDHLGRPISDRNQKSRSTNYTDQSYRPTFNTNFLYRSATRLTQPRPLEMS